MFDGGPALQFADNNENLDLQNFPDTLQFDFSNQDPNVEQDPLAIGIDPNDIDHEIFSYFEGSHQPTFPTQETSYPYYYEDTEQSYHANIEELPPINTLKEPTLSNLREVKHSVKLEPRTGGSSQQWIPENVSIQQPQQIQSPQFEDIFPTEAQTVKVLGETRVIVTPLSVDTKFQVGF